MATITKSRRAPEYIPTPEQIAEACAEIHQRRLAAFDAAPPEPTEEERKALARERSRRRRAATKAAANLELQQTGETVTEPLDIDHRDPRQTEQWIPVPTVEEPQTTGRKPAAQRHRNEFYTRFFPSWERLTTRHEHEARAQSEQWRDALAEKRKRYKPEYVQTQHVPTWTVEPSFEGCTARERINDELEVMGDFRSVNSEVEFMPCFLALQRRILARYLGE
jgi:hypothetical protein